MEEPDYRTRCLEEKENVCIGCGSDGPLIVHHVNGDREDNRLENLVPVCRPCHSRIHIGTDLPPHLQHYRDQLPEQAKDWKHEEPREDDGTTTISVSDENWRWLNQQKNIGDSFDDAVSNVRERLKED